MSRSKLILLVVLMAMGMTTTVADGMFEDRLTTYEYTTDEVNAAAKTDLDLTLAPFRLAGTLNRNTSEFERVHHLFARVVDVAMQRSAFARNLDWKVYVHEGRVAEAYSRAGGKIVISARFLERYQPNDAELAFVIGHEIAHVLCEHERMNLSAVWRRNWQHKVAVRNAMDVLDTEPMVRALAAPVVRLQERVADRIGIELATGAGVDPISALGFFDKSADSVQGGIFPDLHDSPLERKTSLLQVATSFPFRPIATIFRGRDVSCAP